MHPLTSSSSTRTNTTHTHSGQGHKKNHNRYCSNPDTAAGGHNINNACNTFHRSHAPEHVLDLHNHTKLQAIEKLTRFLDQLRHPYSSSHSTTNTTNTPPLLPVTVITGSGKHSSHGPVIRQAVQSLFERRQMNFHLNRGRGSFWVDALSGIDLQDRDRMRREGTKILLVPNEPADGVDVVHQERKRVDVVGDDVLSRGVFPIPRDVVEDDEVMERVKRVSHSESVRMRSLMMEEEKKVKKALEESRKMMEKEEVEVDQEEEEFQKVLRLSKWQHEKEQQDNKTQDETMWKQAMELSLKVEQETEEMERIELEKVLALSKKINKTQDDCHHDHDNCDDEYILMQVLESSKHQPQQMDFEEQVQLALQESLQLS
jgi:hypothetical protein